MANRLVSWLRGDTVRNPMMIGDLREAIGAQIVPVYQNNKPQWLEQSLWKNDRHAYRINTLVFGCVQYVSEAAGSAPLRLRKEREAGQYDYVDDHALNMLLANPNVRMGGGAFISFVVMLMCVMGFAVIEKERSVTGRIIGLWPLRADWLRPVPRKDGRFDWEYRVPDMMPRTLKAEDVIALSYADTPDQRATGIGPIEVAFKSVQTKTALIDYLKSFVDRGMMPLYFAEPQMDGATARAWSSKDATDAFREAFRALTQASSGDILISPGIKDVRALGFDINQLAYLDLRNVQDADVVQAFGIPHVIAQTMLGVEHSTYSNYAEARKAFYEGKMSSIWARIDDAFTRQLLPDFEVDRKFDLTFDVSDVVALKDNENERIARSVSMFDAGLVSRSVAQREAGIDVHGADVFKISIGTMLVPVNDTGQRARAIVHEPQHRALPMGQRVVLLNGSDRDEDVVAWFEGSFPEYEGMLTTTAPWIWDQAKHRYENTDTGVIVGQEELVRLRDDAAAKLGPMLSPALEQAFDDASKLSTAKDSGQGLLMLSILAMYMLGKGGRAMITADDVPVTTAIIETQVSFYLGFVEDIGNGKITSLAQIQARANLYGIALVQASDRGQAASYGAARALPYWPGDGATICKANCRCRWVYSDTEDGSTAAWWRDIHDGQPPECRVCWGRSQEYPVESPFVIRSAT